MWSRQSSVARGDSDSEPWLLAADRGGQPAGPGPLGQSPEGLPELLNSRDQRANACPSYVKVVDPIGG